MSDTHSGNTPSSFSFSLDERIGRFYNEQTLSADKLADLRGLIADRPLQQPPTQQRTARAPTLSNSWLLGAVAALFVVCLGLGALIVQQAGNQQQQIDRVAAEIALNHAKQFDTEFATESIASLVTEMTLLDFAPVSPKRLQYDNYAMLGARYCTIGSAIAVQVHLEDEAEHAYTLYQFRDAPQLLLGDTNEVAITVEGIEVQLWREGEVMMGLAQRRPSDR